MAWYRTFFIIAMILCSLSAARAGGNPGQWLTLDANAYDDRFYRFVERQAQAEVLADDLGWAEGPVWAQDLDSLLFSDVAANRIYIWHAKRGLAVYLTPSGHNPDGPVQAWRGSNGLAIDTSGNLILAQQGNRKLARMRASLQDPVANYAILASEYQGKSLNSPNDVLLHPSGDIYFTDPPYGLDGFEKSAAIELDYFALFRLNTEGILSTVTTALEKPNGIALSPDGLTLYVSNSETNKAQIVAIDLDSGGNAGVSRLFFDGSKLTGDGPGSTDGMAMHKSGYLFASVPNGFAIFSPAGELLGKVGLGQVTNLAFDAAYDWLYITTPKRLLRLAVERAD